MNKYIALLRGVNVGGKNKISMAALKVAFEKQGFNNVVTYINSGNIIFESELKEFDIQRICENLIEINFNLNISVMIISVDELVEALTNAPKWWNNEANAKHNAIFVIHPMTAAIICNEIGDIKPEYEKVAYLGKVIFWSAPLATFSHTRWSKIVENKKLYQAITIRNATTTLKLAEFK